MGCCAASRWPRLVQPDEKAGEQNESCQAMPGIEVTVAEIGEEAAEAGDSAGEQCPPCPGLVLEQRKLGEPEIEDGDGDEGAAEADAVVKHEMDDAAFIDRAKIL